MEDSRLGGLLVLIGGISYLTSGSLTLGSAIASYLVHQIPLSPSQSSLLQEVPLYPLVFSVVASLVEIASGLFVIRTGRLLVGGELGRARGRAWRVSLFGVVGAAAFFASDEYSFPIGPFFSYIFYGSLSSALYWGLIAIIAGAWFSFWGAKKAALD